MIHELGLVADNQPQVTGLHKCNNHAAPSFAVYGVSSRTHEPYMHACHEVKSSKCAGCKWR